MVHPVEEQTQVAVAVELGVAAQEEMQLVVLQETERQPVVEMVALGLAEAVMEIPGLLMVAEVVGLLQIVELIEPGEQVPMVR
jgi:hypothetical protein